MARIYLSPSLQEGNPYVTGENEEYNTAETLLKQELEIELRITDIIQHNTVSQALPDIP